MLWSKSLVQALLSTTLFFNAIAIPVHTALQTTSNTITKTVTISSQAGPINTGIVVNVGDVVQITATGLINNGSTDPNYPNLSSPDGLQLPAANPYGRPLLPNISSTSLVGSIGSGFSGQALLDDGQDINPRGVSGTQIGYPGIFGPGYIGSSFTGVATVSGTIFLALNDAPLTDNSGSFTIHITISQSWTLMFYFAADNDLEAHYSRLYDDLNNVKKNSLVNIVALWDGGKIADSEFKSIKIGGKASTISAGGEYDMGNPLSLVNLINYAKQNYPASYYGLVMMDHGTGLNGSMFDKTSNSRLSVKDMGAALNIVSQNGQSPIDILYMEACMMGMIEDAYQIRSTIKFYVASESISNAFPGVYSAFTNKITATMTPEQLARLIVDEYSQEVIKYSTYYGPNWQYTISAADMRQIDALANSIKSFARIMYSKPAELLNAARHVQRFDSNNDGLLTVDDDYVDLYHFVDLVETNSQDQNVITVSQDVKSAIDKYIIVAKKQSGIRWDTKKYYNLQSSYGVSIFFPHAKSSYYNSNNFDFAIGSNWGLIVNSEEQQSDLDTWGALVVEYIKIFAADSIDNPSPPDLVPLIETPSLFLVHLPSVQKP